MSTGNPYVMSAANPYDTPVEFFGSETSDNAPVRRSIRIKRISPIAAAKVFGVLCGGLAFVGSLVTGSTLLVTGLFYSANQGGIALSSGLFMVPFIYGCIGFIGGAILSFSYNIAVGITGGIKIDIEARANLSRQIQ